MGGWLCTYLMQKGAKVSGYARAPSTVPSFFDTVGLGDKLEQSTIAELRDLESLKSAMATAQPQVIFHLAAQPLVLSAFANPRETFETNVMGTVNVLEAARDLPDLSAMLMVTTDKVYQNNNWHWAYRENDPLGGKEPYSASKAASEFAIDAYRNSYFPELGIATLRVGNIIGGGDWAEYRLLPDAVRGFLNAQPLILRNPHSTRPWQHVLDPLPGYLALAERLAGDGPGFSGGWNLGPAQTDCRPVAELAHIFATEWGEGATVEIAESATVFEEKLLSLDSAKAQSELGWRPRWQLLQALKATAAWYKAQSQEQDMWAFTQAQIGEFDG